MPRSRWKLLQPSHIKAIAGEIKTLLLRHYNVPLEIPFRQFRDGAIYFGVGLGSVLMANGYMTPSLWQELIVLCGLLLGGIGFVMAMLAQTRMIIARLVRFFDSKK